MAAAASPVGRRAGLRSEFGSWKDSLPPLRQRAPWAQHARLACRPHLHPLGKQWLEPIHRALRSAQSNCPLALELSLQGSGLRVRVSHCAVTGCCHPTGTLGCPPWNPGPDDRWKSCPCSLNLKTQVGEINAPCVVFETLTSPPASQGAVCECSTPTATSPTSPLPPARSSLSNYGI